MSIQKAKKGQTGAQTSLPLFWRRDVYNLQILFLKIWRLSSISLNQNINAISDGRFVTRTMDGALDILESFFVRRKKPAIVT
jgi:hypothetical protein